MAEPSSMALIVFGMASINYSNLMGARDIQIHNIQNCSSKRFAEASGCIKASALDQILVFAHRVI